MYRSYLTSLQTLHAPEGTESAGGGAPAPTPDTTPDTTPEPTPASSGNAGRTFTQAEMEDIVKERLDRDRKAREADAKTKAERLQMDAEQRYAADKADLERERDDARREASLARYEASLKGEVADMDLALMVLERSEEKYVKDGKVDLKALLKDKPLLAPARATAPGAGGVQGTAAPDASTFSGALAADGIKF